MLFCRQKIIKEKAVPKIEGYMFEEHDLVRASATECMCNLVLSTEVRHIHRLLYSTNMLERLK